MKGQNLKFAEQYADCFPVGEGAEGGGFSPISYRLNDPENKVIVEQMAGIVAQVFAAPLLSESLEETKARADVAVATFIRQIGKFNYGIINKNSR